MRRIVFTLLVGGLGLATLLSLGVWQLQRLAWKEGVLAEIAARMNAPLPVFPARPEEARDEYRLVRVTGEIGARELHVLTSARPDGPGFRIIAPLTLADGRRVLVDRGFVPEAAKSLPRSGGPAQITANILWPDDVTRYTPAPDERRNMWFARDAVAMAKALGTEPVMLVARSDTGAGIRPLPVTVNIPNDHLEYALTWFGLAAGWAGMTLLFLIRGQRAGKALETEPAGH
ncbi:MAG: SURF1 family protein [Pseudomonadota bacterium]